jgi:hypothetical protein
MPASRPTSRPLLLLLLLVLVSLFAPVSSHAQATTETTVGSVHIIADDTANLDAVTFAETSAPAITEAWQQFTALFATEPANGVTVTLVPTIDPATINGWHWVAESAWMAPDASTALVATADFQQLTPIEMTNIVRNVLARAFIQQAGAGRVPPGFLAGLARYLESPVVATQARIGSLVQGQDQAGTLPGWNDIASDLPGTLSAEERTANGYAVVAFLADRYGMIGLRNLVAGFASNQDLDTNLTSTFGQSIPGLAGAWETFLPRWFASGWRENAAAAFDITRAEQLFDRGAYEAASAEAERSQRLFTDINDQAGLSRVEALLAQCAVGLQADGLMQQSEQALVAHDYRGAMTYLLQAESLYDVLPAEHRPETSIERYRTLATAGMEADARLEAALVAGDDWFKAAAARGDAVAAGDAYAVLGDEEKRQTAADLVTEIDTRLWRTIYLLSAIVTGLIAWLVAWSWLRHPARLRWPSPRGMAISRSETR